MTDKEFESAQRFLSEVRKAYRDFKQKVGDNSDAILYAQDNLSLYSPWMNKEGEK